MTSHVVHHQRGHPGGRPSHRQGIQRIIPTAVHHNARLLPLREAPRAAQRNHHPGPHGRHRAGSPVENRLLPVIMKTGILKKVQVILIALLPRLIQRPHRLHPSLRMALMMWTVVRSLVTNRKRKNHRTCSFTCLITMRHVC